MGAPLLISNLFMSCIKSDGITTPTDYEGKWSLLAISIGVSEIMEYDINGNPVAEYYPNLITDGSTAFTYRIDNVPIITGNLTEIRPGEFYHDIYANSKLYEDEQSYIDAFNPDNNTIPNYCVYKKDDLVSIVTDRSQKYLWLSANKNKLIDVLSNDKEFVDNLVLDISNQLNLNLIKFDITYLFDQNEQIIHEVTEEVTDEVTKVDEVTEGLTEKVTEQNEEVTEMDEVTEEVEIEVEQEVEEVEIEEEVEEVEIEDVEEVIDEVEEVEIEEVEEKIEEVEIEEEVEEVEIEDVEEVNDEVDEVKNEEDSSDEDESLAGNTLLIPGVRTYPMVRPFNYGYHRYYY